MEKGGSLPMQDLFIMSHSEIIMEKHKSFWSVLQRVWKGLFWWWQKAFSSNSIAYYISTQNKTFSFPLKTPELRQTSLSSSWNEEEKNGSTSICRSKTEKQLTLKKKKKAWLVFEVGGGEKISFFMIKVFRFHSKDTKINIIFHKWQTPWNLQL